MGGELSCTAANEKRVAEHKPTEATEWQSYMNYVQVKISCIARSEYVGDMGRRGGARGRGNCELERGKEGLVG